MKVNVEFNTENRQDFNLLGLFGSAVFSYAKAVAEMEERQEKTENEKTTQGATEPEPSDNTPGQKVRRTRKKKEEEQPKAEESKSEEPQEPVDAESPTPDEVENAETKEEEVEAQSELPFGDCLPETKKVDEPEISTCSAEEWRKIFREKTIQLGLSTEDMQPGEHADRKNHFNDFVHRLSGDYGNRIPSQLTDEQRYRFVAQFKNIFWNEESNSYSCKAPF